MTIDQLKRLLLTWRDANNMPRDPQYVSDIAHDQIERMEAALMECIKAMYSWRRDDASKAMALAFDAMNVRECSNGRLAGSRRVSPGQLPPVETSAEPDCSGVTPSL